MSLPAASFHGLYERYGRDAYRFALYLCGDASRAEDLSAEAFLRIWAARTPLQLPTAKSYLLAVVRNLYTEQWRKLRREAPLGPLETQTQATGGKSAEQRLDEQAELERVMAALQALPEMERAALLLRSEHGMQYEEIARVLGLSVAAARVKVHRARQQLMEIRKGKGLR